MGLHDASGVAPSRLGPRRAALVAFLGAICVLLLEPRAAHTQDDAQATEGRIKAAYLYKFPGYVEWPARGGPREPFTIGVAGGGPVAEELARLAAGRTIDGRAISVRAVDLDDSLEDLEIFFVADRERNRLDEWLSPARELPVLTVTESDGALSEGSIVNFTIDDDRVRFEISLPAAGRSGLRLDSRLLAVAQRVARVTE